MNNQIPFMMPPNQMYNPFYMPNDPNYNQSKINELENRIKTLEDKVKTLENNLNMNNPNNYKSSLYMM